MQVLLPPQQTSAVLLPRMERATAYEDLEFQPQMPARFASEQLPLHSTTAAILSSSWSLPTAFAALRPLRTASSTISSLYSRVCGDLLGSRRVGVEVAGCDGVVANVPRLDAIHTVNRSLVAWGAVLFRLSLMEARAARCRSRLRPAL